MIRSPACVRVALRRALCTLAMGVALPALAQLPPAGDVPSVTVSASATAQVANDRAHAWLRAEAEAAEAAAAARQVNAVAARALARMKAVPGMTVATSGYGTQPVSERGKPTRWRVTQTFTVESGDFEALAALVTRLQADDGLLLSGLNFSVSRAAHERAQRDLLREAVHTWQTRAGDAASALGFPGWRPGHVTVQTSEGGRTPYPVMRAVTAMTAEASPVAIEAGFSEVTVNVSGDAWLDTTRAPGR